MTSLLKAIASAVLVLGIAPATVHASESALQFMDNLQGLCGQRFEGAMSYPADPKHDFAGKALVAQFASCNSKEVRVPFLVGADRSRTWVITRTPDGLYLRHDHRHEDGTPDAQTMYGGPSGATGTALSQSFYADKYTADLIKGASTNVWTISVSADKRTLTYHLERDARPRFTAVLKRTSP